MSKWLPIAEAKDGTLYLFCDMKATELSKSYFVDWIAQGNFCNDKTHQATHFMSLPNPPETKP